MRGSAISLVQGGVQRYLWVSEGLRDMFGSVRVQRYVWVSEGFRDIFESVRGSEISMGQ